MKWHTQACMTLVSMLHLRATNAANNNQNLEVDLIFPKDNGVYRSPSTGLPVTVALQNSAAAFQYGWNVNFEFRPVTDQQQIDYPTVVFSNKINSSKPSNVTDPYFLTSSSGFLLPGQYTLSWRLNVASYCDFDDTSDPSTQNSTLFYNNKQISSGEISLTIVDDNTQTEAPADLFSNDNSKQCATNLGVIGYASTSQYANQILTVGSFDVSKGSYVFPSSTAAAACVVTMSPSTTPNPCAVTVERAVQTSIYSAMSWSMPAASTSSPAGSGAAGSLGMEFGKGMGVVYVLLVPFVLGVWLV